MGGEKRKVNVSHALFGYFCSIMNTKRYLRDLEAERVHHMTGDTY